MDIGARGEALLPVPGVVFVGDVPEGPADEAPAEETRATDDHDEPDDRTP